MGDNRCAAKQLIPPSLRHGHCASRHFKPRLWHLTTISRDDGMPCLPPVWAGSLCFVQDVLKRRAPHRSMRGRFCCARLGGRGGRGCRRWWGVVGGGRGAGGDIGSRNGSRAIGEISQPRAQQPCQNHQTEDGQLHLARAGFFLSCGRSRNGSPRRAWQVASRHAGAHCPTAPGEQVDHALAEIRPQLLIIPGWGTPAARAIVVIIARRAARAAFVIIVAARTRAAWCIVILFPARTRAASFIILNAAAWRRHHARLVALIAP